MKKIMSTLGAIALLSSTSAFANVLTFSGATHCNEDAVKHASSVNTLIQSQGTVNALKIMATENVGATEKGYFIFDPQFDRSGSSARYFNCSVPLNSNVGNFSMSVYGTVNDINSAAGGCTISRMRRVSDGGIWKWFRYGTGKGFDWSDITNYNISGEQFVDYTAININNNFEENTTLELKCRTTWAGGSVSVGQITLDY